MDTDDLISFNAFCREQLKICPSHGRRLIRQGRLRVETFPLFEGGRSQFLKRSTAEAIRATAVAKADGGDRE